MWESIYSMIVPSISSITKGTLKNKYCEKVEKTPGKIKGYKNCPPNSTPDALDK